MKKELPKAYYKFKAYLREQLSWDKGQLNEVFRDICEYFDLSVHIIDNILLDKHIKMSDSGRRCIMLQFRYGDFVHGAIAFIELPSGIWERQYIEGWDRFPSVGIFRHE